MEYITNFIDQYELHDKAVFWGVRVVVALLIFLVGKWIAHRVAHAIERMLLKRTDKTLADFLSNVVYGLLLAVVIIAALDRLGVQTTALLAILGAAGLAIGLALQGSLSNFAAGIMLLIFRPFRVGEFVEVAGSMGTVRTLRVFHTLLTTLGGQELWIPNSNIVADEITNYSALPTRRVDIAVACSYDDDLREARKAIQQVIDADDRILADPAPQILVVELAASGVKFAVRPWTQTADWWATTCDLTENIKIAFDRHGLTIPYPQRDVHVYPHESSDAGKDSSTGFKVRRTEPSERISGDDKPRN